MRILLEVALPFLAPFAAYAAYRLLVTNGEGFLQHTPWSLLSIAGLALACAALASLAFMGGAPPGGRYVPPGWKPPMNASDASAAQASASPAMLSRDQGVRWRKPSPLVTSSR